MLPSELYPLRSSFSVKRSDWGLGPADAINAEQTQMKKLAEKTMVVIPGLVK